MSIIPYCNFLLGTFNGIATYKQNPIDNMLLITYFSIITPYQVASAYSRLDLIGRLKLRAVSPCISVPILISMVTGANLLVFTMGHVSGKIAYSAYSTPLN
jgi:hypothetical protein